MMKKNSKIYVAGHDGMVGTALMSELKKRGYNNLITKKFNNLDLRNQSSVEDFLSKEKPSYLFLIAGKVGGIQANINYPATFLYDNLMIAANVINSAYKNNVKKLIFLGSSCIYPRNAKQPMKEEYLLTDVLEPTNEGYAIGKIAGLKLCEYYNKQYNCNFIAAMPPNLFGPNDSFSLKNSHVISALIQKIDNAKQKNSEFVEMWGSGNARREFLFVEDLVDGLIFLMNNYSGNHFINIGSGIDISIKELADLIKDVIGYKGCFVWDERKPDGMPKKLMDSTKIHKLGWKNKRSLKNGIEKTINWYYENVKGKQDEL